MQTPTPMSLMQFQDYGATPGFDTPMYEQSVGTMMDMELTSGSSLEDRYAAVLGQVLQAGNARVAVNKMESICTSRAQQLRREVSNVTHKPARFMHLQSLAQEFEAQVATWSLVFCLYCQEDPPAGTGGPVVQGAGGRRTARQLLADKVTENAALNRCAAVVSWLEYLEDDSLTAEGEATQPRFSAQEGVWLETQQRKGQGGVVSELDPDAPARQGANLHPDNAAAEERLLQRTWKLIRAGRYADARALLRSSGQPWRAASIGGPAGDYGPLPVGLAATKQEQDIPQPAQAEDLACEVEMGGPAAARALWKWTCQQVALQAAASATPGSKYEAGIYGVIASHLPSILPLCSTWKDQCWAYCRTWLDQAADVELGSQHVQGHANAATLAGLGADEVVVDVVCRFTGQAKGKSAVQGAVAAAGGVVPALNSTDGAAGRQGPQSFPAVFAALQGSSLPAVAAASQDPMQHVQQFLIQDAMSALSEHLYNWLNYNDAAGLAEEEDDVLGLPSKSTRMKVFACHLLLMLKALGRLHGAAHSHEELLYSSRIDAATESVLNLYLAALIDRGRYALVPGYLCHLPQHHRSTLANEALVKLTQQLAAAPASLDGSPADELAREVYSNMAHWFSHCYMQQQKPQEQVGHQLYTAIRAQEARILIGQFVEGVRLRGYTTTPGARLPNVSSSGRAPGPVHAEEVFSPTPQSLLNSDVGSSPYSRVCALRWLFYPHLHASDGDAGAVADPDFWTYPLALCCAVLQELALGDDSCAQAALHLLTRILPPGFTNAARSQVDSLQQQAGELRARAAALQSEAMSADAPGVMQSQAEAQHAQAVADGLSFFLRELQHWHTYFSLERQAAAWLQDFEAFKEVRAYPGADAERQHLQQSGSQLLQQMQSQLLTASWMSGLPTTLASADDDPEPVCLVVTQPAEATVQQQAAAHEEDDALGVSQAQRPYPVLKGAALAALEQQLHASLQQAVARLASAPDTYGNAGRVSVRITSPGEAEGHLTITLFCNWADNQAVSDLTEVCKDLVQGSVAGAPKVLVVNMLAPRGVATATCTACCLAKATVLCAKVHYALSVLGGDGSDGATLVEQLAVDALQPSTSGPQILADVLSREQLAAVLKLEAEVRVEVLSHQARR